MDEMERLRILVVGGGGREHAICWKLAQSPLVSNIFCAPGNGGTAKEDKTENVDIGVMEFDKLAAFASKERVHLVVVGPDDPIASGAVDFFEGKGFRVFGPSKAAARLESSKIFAKEFMVTHHIPTARYLTFNNLADAMDAVNEHPWARVVKADGLALGKGVFVCESAEEACDALKRLFDEKLFGEAGKRVVIEERLAGEELSLLMFCDGKRLIPMPASRDYKRRFDGDKGPNTGGMGAFSPVELYGYCQKEIENQVLEPLRRALQSRQFKYKGVLYAGLMITARQLEGTGLVYQPYVLEFNARFGDPETQALLPLLNSDLAAILWACTDGKLNHADIVWSEESSCCVVATAATYPESGSKGETITVQAMPEGVHLFHAGTKLDEGKLLTNGGRIVSVTSVAATIDGATKNAYAGLSKVTFAGLDFRKDIARRVHS